ncbi:HD domain-containing protein [Agarilytica rhodophyticola]|uniref:HD domain-containing protein n=1 Tax=Agarilytica rhodophyticola TaxID=1737490 RepID=UPI000B34956C|nr:HD domain-containing protein [Agarilytica rhodophyticola]
MSIFETVKIPDTKLCKSAFQLVKDCHEPFLFNHVLRTFFFGAFAGQKASCNIDMEMLFLGAVLHDIGLVEDYVEDNRFEIDGANAAAKFLQASGYPDEKIEIVWDAIALHSTMGIPQCKQAEIALVQMGAGIDVGAIPLHIINAKIVDEVIDRYPRENFKKMMTSRVAEVAGRKPETSMHTFAADLAEQHVEGFHRHNFCDVIHNAGFKE